MPNNHQLFVNYMQSNIVTAKAKSAVLTTFLFTNQNISNSAATSSKPNSPGVNIKTGTKE